MAVIEQRGPGKRLASNRGRFVVYEMNGRQVIRAWPKKASKKPNLATLQTRETFREAAFQAKHVDADTQALVNEITRGTQFLPRDLIFQMFYGRLATITMADGRKIYSMATIGDISALLDALSQTPGTLLARGTDLWQAVPPGLPGQVLVNPGDNLPPVWADLDIASGAGAVSALQGALEYANSTTSFATKGQMFSVDLPIEVTSIDALFTAVGTYAPHKAGVARLSDFSTSPTVDAILGESPTQNPTTTAMHHERFALPSPIVLSPGVPYLAYLTVDYGSGTEACRPMNFSGTYTTYLAPPPILFGPNACWIATRNLSPGNTLNAVAAPGYGIGIRGQIVSDDDTTE